MANGTSEAAMIKIGDGTGVVAGGNGDDLLLAETQVFSGSFQAINNSGVSGTVRVSAEGDLLHVQADVSGLETGQAHQLEIHGFIASGDVPQDSTAITADLNSDGDGFIESSEAARAVGPVLVDLGSSVAGADGSVHVDQTLSLGALSGLTLGDSAADLFPLDFRTVEVHGLSVPGVAGLGTADTVAAGIDSPGEVDGSGGYKAALPVGSAALQAESVTTTTDANANLSGVTVVGGNGDDRLIGGHGDDLIVAGRGNDVLAGGAGSDDLVGGAGADHFIVGQGKDVITDFNAAAGDRLVFGNDAQSAAPVLHNTNQGTWVIAGDGAIEDPASQGVLLLGVHANSTADAANWFA